ncbi:PaaI family thioesterase [Leptospira sp. GIMC2001]|uniref:PaaI family thioesterase n=1 Tax=Leptospira sp. GIMC2001 TaxID=1513297 RepID=UPI00234B706F|nr:PaaI family thioesterase [Leptospira sp. GIMC2001]WCL47629.1 PaaI family thioesterase [Leptospira sp. GIMC2001]
MNNWKTIKNLETKKCFGCGPANEIGMKLVFESDEHIVRTHFLIPERMAGWANLTHGGITATILDETMAWTVIYLNRTYILTKSMKVDYIKPVFVGESVLCEGRIISPSDDSAKNSKKEVIVIAELKNSKSEVVARAEGVIALFTPEGIRKFGFLDEDFLQEFETVVLAQ